MWKEKESVVGSRGSLALNGHHQLSGDCKTSLDSSRPNTTLRATGAHHFPLHFDRESDSDGGQRRVRGAALLWWGP